MQAVNNAHSWNRFQAMLVAMSPGDVITVENAAVKTAMAPESVQVVLETLSRADLFERHGDQFVRVGYGCHASGDLR